MRDLFFYDIERGSISYTLLIEKLKSFDFYENICQEDEMENVFIKIILSLLLEEELILLDSDFSDLERENMLEGIKKYRKKIDLSYVSSISDINLSSENKAKLVLFTSGTTGQPKRIEHSLSSLTQNIKIGEQFKNNVWGFAYNPTHMAGIQVFLQALFNKNTIVRLFGLTREHIFNSIEKQNITNISATPTFYKMLMPTDCEFKTVKRITFGGEKLSDKIYAETKKMFPHAKLLNVYASTEAGALFASSGETFIVKKEMKSFVKIEDNVLFIHKSKVGVSENMKFEGGWYNTGDLVEVVNSEPLEVKFISRKNEMINTGGYKVNPHEVEELIMRYKGVQDVKVYGKANSVLGAIVCADIVANREINKQDLMGYLSEFLQKFKIPRFIKFVDFIEKTRTGKLKR